MRVFYVINEDQSYLFSARTDLDGVGGGILVCVGALGGVHGGVSGG